MSRFATAFSANSAGGGERRSSRKRVSISRVSVSLICRPFPRRYERELYGVARPHGPRETRGLRGGVEVVREVREVLGAVVGHEDQVLQAAAAEALAVQAWLD